LPEGGRVLVTGEPRGSTQFGAITNGALWLAPADAGRVERFDPRTLAHRDSLEVGEPGAFPPDAQAVAVGDEGVWVALASQRAVGLLDKASGEMLRLIELDAMPYSLIEVGGNLWITDFENSEVVRLDIETGDVIARMPVELPTGIAHGEGAVWATVHVGRREEMEPIATNGGRLARIDPQTNTVTALIDVGPRPYTVAVGFGSVWTSDATGGSVTRVDPATNQAVATIDVGEDGVYDVEIAAGSVWAVGSVQHWNEPCEKSGGAFRIDPASNVVDGRVDLPCAGGLISDGDLLWAHGSTSTGRVLLLIEPFER
jgi:streptogramin lyase